MPGGAGGKQWVPGGAGVKQWVPGAVVQEASSGCQVVQEASSDCQGVQEANSGCLEVQEASSGDWRCRRQAVVTGGKQWVPGGCLKVQEASSGDRRQAASISGGTGQQKTFVMILSGHSLLVSKLCLCLGHAWSFLDPIFIPYSIPYSFHKTE